MPALNVTTITAMNAADKAAALVRLRGSKLVKKTPEYADMLEAAGAPAAEVAAARAGGPAVNYSSKSVAELMQLVADRGLTAPPRARKDDLIALLTA
jgi:hypothetical protein